MPCNFWSPAGLRPGTNSFSNYIFNNIHNQLRLFADVYRIIQLQSSGDHLVLQDDCSTLTSWAKANNMEFNITKCKIIQVTPLHNKSSSTYTMNGTPLQPVDHHLYLGVYIHHKYLGNLKLTISVAKQTAF